jgi:hypothetical protein
MFDVADIWARRTGHTVRLVSANDHVHARRSMHYAGLAIDMHSSDPDALAEMMRRAGYRVLWRVAGHFNHLHVEVPDGTPVERERSERKDPLPSPRTSASSPTASSGWR